MSGVEQVMVVGFIHAGKTSLGLRAKYTTVKFNLAEASSKNRTVRNASSVECSKLAARL